MDPGDVPSTVRRRSSRKTTTRPALQYALRYLARGSCSVARLRDRLRTRGYPEPEVGAVVKELRRHGILDDLRLAREMFRIGSEVKLRGRSRLVREADSRGIPCDVIARVEGEHAREVDEHVILQRALRQWVRIHGRVSTERHRGRIYRHLLRRGFEPDAILRELPGRDRMKED